MRSLAYAVVFISAGLIYACNAGLHQPKINTASVIDAIRSTEVRWNEDWKSGDSAKVAAHYASDATMMLPGVASATGPDAIRDNIQQRMNDAAFSLNFSSDQVDVASSGDLAASRGHFTETHTNLETGSSVTTHGTFVMLYKPQPDGQWKVVADIDTPDTPTTANSPGAVSR